MRRPRWLTPAALVVAVLAAGLGVGALESEAPPQAPLSVAVPAGQDTVVHPFRVHVHGARAVEQLTRSEDPVPTEGVWVLVDLSYASVDRPRAMRTFGLLDSSGRFYEDSNRGNGGWFVGPDIWYRGEVAFEVPRDALGDIEFTVWPHSRDQVNPVAYGRTGLTVTDVEPGPVELSRAVLLEGDDR